MNRLESKHHLFYSGEEYKAEFGIKLEGNRKHRRERISSPLSRTLRQAKRVDRLMKLKDIAQQIREWYPETFKLNHKWKEIELEMIKLLSRQGETNMTKPKAKR